MTKHGNIPLINIPYVMAYLAFFSSGLPTQMATVMHVTAKNISRELEKVQ
jgi:hypothetical protein